MKFFTNGINAAAGGGLWKLGSFSRRLPILMKPFSLAMPKTFPLYREDGQYNTAELAQWFHEGALEIARKFDERNQSSYYQNKMQRAWDGMQKMTGESNE